MGRRWLYSYRGSVWILSMISWHTCMQYAFWASVSNLSTIQGRISDCSNLRWYLSKHLFFYSPVDLRPFLQSTDDHCTSLALHAQRWPACWRSPDLRVVFHHLAPLFEPLEPLENTSAWYSIMSIHLLKHFECLRRRFPRPGQKFQVYSLLCIHRSFFSAHS